MLAWEESYKIGHDRMDGQHLVLVALINQLDININDDGVQGILPDVLEAVGAYLGYHFAEEEAVMRAAGYPGLDGHVAMHRAFTEQFDRLLALAAAGQVLQAALKVRSFAIDWLIRHILQADAEYASHIAAAGPDARRPACA